MFDTLTKIKPYFTSSLVLCKYVKVGLLTLGELARYGRRSRRWERGDVLNKFWPVPAVSSWYWNKINYFTEGFVCLLLCF